jgi:hypothetical protein
MFPITSSIENQELPYNTANDYLTQYQFNLGGNWDYQEGYFDHYLDEAHKVWLRLPFEVTRGELTGDTTPAEATIRMGKPFVLKHIYNEGIDREGSPKVLMAVFDQFQTPIDKDAEIEAKWTELAQGYLNKVEQQFPS